MAKPYITGVYDLSKILYENNPHVYLNPTEKLRMGEYVKDGDCYIVGPNLMIWDSTTNMWRGISILAGLSGETATIVVGSTRTGDESSEALALDNAVAIIMFLILLYQEVIRERVDRLVQKEIKVILDQ